MPKEQLQKTPDPERYVMPPDLLNLSPEQLDQRLYELSTGAVKTGQEQIKDLDSMAKNLPKSSPHLPKVEKLKIKATEAVEELTLDLSQNGVEVEEEVGWTPERLAKLQAKVEARKSASEKATSKTQETPEEKMAAERRRELGELTDRLMQSDEKIKKLATELDPKNPTAQQEKEIENIKNKISKELQKIKATGDEESDIYRLLPNFSKVRMAILDFHIKRDEAAAKRIKENYKKGTIKGEVDQAGNVIPPKRIKFLENKVQEMSEERKKYESNGSKKAA